MATRSSRFTHYRTLARRSARARKLTAEIERMARLSTTEWLYYVEVGDIPKRYGIEPAKMKIMIEAVIHANEKRACEAKADDRREKQQTERKQERAAKADRREQERARKEAERLRKEAERIGAAGRGSAQEARGSV